VAVAALPAATPRARTATPAEPVARAAGTSKFGSRSSARRSSGCASRRF
jgi:hypothetical protein